MPTSVLFVCLGNICRSPTAHAVFQHKLCKAGLADNVRVDSAGTGDWHIGAAPDRRASAAALQRGYDMRSLRARQVKAADFLEYQYILAMDRNNLADLRAMRPSAAAGQLELFLHYLPYAGPRDVPDPYYGGADGFEQVLDLVEAAADGLLVHLRQSV